MTLGELTERLILLRDRTDERVDRDALAVAINRLTSIEAAVHHELGLAPRHDRDQGSLDLRGEAPRAARPDRAVADLGVLGA